MAVSRRGGRANGIKVRNIVKASHFCVAVLVRPNAAWKVCGHRRAEIRAATSVHMVRPLRLKGADISAQTHRKFAATAAQIIAL